jgi:hypothetical protein
MEASFMVVTSFLKEPDLAGGREVTGDAGCVV